MMVLFMQLFYNENGNLRFKIALDCHFYVKIMLFFQYYEI